MHVCVQILFDITEATKDKVHLGPPRDRGENLFKWFRYSLFKFCLPLGAGAFSGDFTTNLARQCRAFSRALKIEKLKAPLFRGPEGAGATNDWCIIVQIILQRVFTKESVQI